MSSQLIYEYTHQYASHLIKGNDISGRPPLACDMAINYGGTDKRLLDIGCGNANKILSLTNFYHEIIGLDPSNDLLTLAQTEIKNQTILNFQLVKGVAESLPFKESCFDVVTSILSWWSAPEISKVLNRDGVCLIESLGPNDKTIFTRYFGKDQQGWRGANLNTTMAEIKLNLSQKLSPFFNTIKFLDASWQTAYCEQGLWLLLKNTKSTVRNFDPINDKPFFDTAISELKIDNKVVLTQNRLIILASK